VDTLRKQVGALETKNRKYLDIIGGTVNTEKQESVKEVLASTRKLNDVINMEEVEALLEETQNELGRKDQQIEVLSHELGTLREQLNDFRTS